MSTQDSYEPLRAILVMMDEFFTINDFLERLHSDLKEGDELLLVKGFLLSSMYAIEVSRGVYVNLHYLYEIDEFIRGTQRVRNIRLGKLNAES